VEKQSLFDRSSFRGEKIIHYQFRQYLRDRNYALQQCYAHTKVFRDTCLCYAPSRHGASRFPQRLSCRSLKLMNVAGQCWGRLQIRVLQLVLSSFNPFGKLGCLWRGCWRLGMILSLKSQSSRFIPMKCWILMYSPAVGSCRAVTWALHVEWLQAAVRGGLSSWVKASGKSFLELSGVCLLALTHPACTGGLQLPCMWWQCWG
jgi:hypothetical protein